MGVVEKVNLANRKVAMRGPRTVLAVPRPAQGPTPILQSKNLLQIFASATASSTPKARRYIEVSRHAEQCPPGRTDALVAAATCAQ